MIDFIWKSIISKFRLLEFLIIDNKKQFESKKFKNFCTSLSIDLRFSLVVHSQSNGQAELMNRITMQALKKNLSDVEGL